MLDDDGIDDGSILLSTGGIIRTFAGVVGINVTDSHRNDFVYGGYDEANETALVHPSRADDECDEPRLSAADCVALADMMIERWTAFRDEAQRRLDA